MINPILRDLKLNDIYSHIYIIVSIVKLNVDFDREMANTALLALGLNIGLRSLLKITFLWLLYFKADKWFKKDLK